MMLYHPYSMTKPQMSRKVEIQLCMSAVSFTFSVMLCHFQWSQLHMAIEERQMQNIQLSKAELTSQHIFICTCFKITCQQKRKVSRPDVEPSHLRAVRAPFFRDIIQYTAPRCSLSLSLHDYNLAVCSGNELIPPKAYEHTLQEGWDPRLWLPDGGYNCPNLLVLFFSVYQLHHQWLTLLTGQVSYCCFNRQLYWVFALEARNLAKFGGPCCNWATFLCLQRIHCIYLRMHMAQTSKRNIYTLHFGSISVAGLHKGVMCI